MSHAAALAVALALTSSPSDGWKVVAREQGVIVSSRDTDSSAAELKAVGVIDAHPEAVWKAIRDYGRYTETMPYVEEARVVAEEDGGRIIHFYSVVNAPLVDRRDYTIRIVDESQWKDGQGYFLARWTPSDQGPPEKKGVVRVKRNEGSWRLEPRDGGAKTFAVYSVHTDPGGTIPRWVADQANNTAVPNVFLALRKAVAKGR